MPNWCENLVTIYAKLQTIRTFYKECINPDNRITINTCETGGFVADDKWAQRVLDVPNEEFEALTKEQRINLYGFDGRCEASTFQQLPLLSEENIECNDFMLYEVCCLTAWSPLTEIVKAIVNRYKCAVTLVYNESGNGVQGGFGCHYSPDTNSLVVDFDYTIPCYAAMNLPG
jgi:hypothetical protein